MPTPSETPISPKTLKEIASGISTGNEVSINFNKLLKADNRAKSLGIGDPNNNSKNAEALSNKAIGAIEKAKIISQETLEQTIDHPELWVLLASLQKNMLLTIEIFNNLIKLLEETEQSKMETVSKLENTIRALKAVKLFNQTNLELTTAHPELWELISIFKKNGALNEETFIRISDITDAELIPAFTALAETGLATPRKMDQVAKNSKLWPLIILLKKSDSLYGETFNRVINITNPQQIRLFNALARANFATPESMDRAQNHPNLWDVIQTLGNKSALNEPVFESLFANNNFLTIVKYFKRHADYLLTLDNLDNLVHHPRLYTDFKFLFLKLDTSQIQSSVPSVLIDFMNERASQESRASKVLPQSNRSLGSSPHLAGFLSYRSKPSALTECNTPTNKPHSQ
jgi:hypothetical protein